MELVEAGLVNKFQTYCDSVLWPWSVQLQVAQLSGCIWVHLSCIWQVNYMILVGPFQLTYSVLKDPDCAEHFQHNAGAVG